MLLRLLSVASLLALLGSCSREERPKDVLDNATFAKIYCALGEAGKKAGTESVGVVEGFNPDTTLLRFGVSKEQFEKTVRYYHEDLQRWRDFYSEVVMTQEGTRNKAVPRSR